ncbi:hypothetical protein INS49_003337 [Diaporthe citri]|uniref:uncharacterized protein n=1 Tax=Diaporthe citri TaxID=83186 RepID=UPI001C817C32|nr:uncharacterized protein INS49_003337 [Diaporthe citri]KAG6355375.1 hypothetical protein INS49_003337 [Diaporthe citri]
MDETSPRDQNSDQFRDILSSALIEKIQKPQKGRGNKQRKRGRAANTGTAAVSNGEAASEADVEELSEFSDYIASIVFENLPLELQTITHRVWAESPGLQEEYALPLTSNDISDKITPTLDPEVSESLTTYGILTPPAEDITTFLAPILTAYLTATTTPPPPPSATRTLTTDCEICGRDWVPLTYHHLVPRAVHAKALRRGWHREEDLQAAAWLCRACHSFVHRLAGNEELAREYHTVGRLLAREEVRGFAAWVGRVRWRARQHGTQPRTAAASPPSRGAAGSASHGTPEASPHLWSRPCSTRLDLSEVLARAAPGPRRRYHARLVGEGVVVCRWGPGPAEGRGAAVRAGVAPVQEGDGPPGVSASTKDLRRLRDRLPRLEHFDHDLVVQDVTDMRIWEAPSHAGLCYLPPVDALARMFGD